MKLRNLLACVLLLISAASLSAQPNKKEPDLDFNNRLLMECCLNIGLFTNGFYWESLDGDMWYIVENPIKNVDCNGNSGPQLCYTILLCPFEVAEVQASVVQGKSEVIPEVDYSWRRILDSKFPNPPVIRQTDKPWRYNYQPDQKSN